MGERRTFVKRRRHTPEQIVRELREADRLLGEGSEVPEVAKGMDGRPAARGVQPGLAIPDQRLGQRPQ